MKKISELQKDNQDTNKSKWFLDAEKSGFFERTGSKMKKIIYIASLAGMGLFLNSCMVGYVADEPGYVEYARPMRPSEQHIWIDGDWGWNNQTHVYVQKAGYWDKPRQGQSFVSGHWQQSPKGKSWAKGHWQKQDKK
jgi:hypothetical protein